MRMNAELQKQIVGYGPSQEHIAELQFTALFGGKPDERTCRKRHDGYIRSLARFVSLALKPASTYQATGPRRQGDSFDLELLTALAAPV